MSLKDRQVTIVGAGVAGLATAIALGRLGARVQVLEQADEILDVGAGLQVSPNGAAVLKALGLGDRLAAIGDRSSGVVLRNGNDGDTVLKLDLRQLRPDQPYYFIHRADLIDMLAAAARSVGAHVHLDHKIAAVTLGDHPPRLVTTTGKEITPDILIGADGIHSLVHRALNGKVVPFFTHQVAWRAIIPADAGIEPVAQVFMGPGRHLVTYPMRNGTMRNIVAVEERHAWADEGWSQRDDPIALRMAFVDFIPEVRGWLDQVEIPHLWGLFRHPVAPLWHGNGAAILGDAAHPTLPFLAQGANMALEDAWVLADSLDNADSVEEGFATFQERRLGRVTRAVETANGNAKAYHLGGITRVAAHLGLKLGAAIAPEAPLKRFDWLYGHDVTKGA